MRTIEQRVSDRVNELLLKGKMRERIGDESKKVKRPERGFTAFEIYSDSRLNLSEADVLGVLNKLVSEKKLKIEKLVYYKVK